MITDKPVSAFIMSEKCGLIIRVPSLLKVAQFKGFTVKRNVSPYKLGRNMVLMAFFVIAILFTTLSLNMVSNLIKTTWSTAFTTDVMTSLAKSTNVPSLL